MHKSIDPLGRFPGNGASAIASQQPDEIQSRWRFRFPNLADSLQCDYAAVLRAAYTADEGIASLRGAKKGEAAKPPPPRVAIIGCGLAGSVAARELTRAGCHVTIVEATDRLGGRTYSDRAPDPADPTKAQLQTYEQGAMRIPFFNTVAPRKPGVGPWPGGPYHSTYDEPTVNSVNEFYTLLHGVWTAAFADPGKAPGPTVNGKAGFPGVATGVLMNGGKGVDLASMFHMAPPAQKIFYQWPAEATDAPDLEAWPLPTGVNNASADALNTGTAADNWPTSPITNTVTDPNNEAAFICFYDRRSATGEPIRTPWAPCATDGATTVGPVPAIALPHAMPRDARHVPPQVAGSIPDQNAWMMGVTALRSVYYKWVLFASIMAHAFQKTPPGAPAFTLDGIDVEECADSHYDNAATWEAWWRDKMMPHYQNINFYELTVTAPVLPSEFTTSAATGKKCWKVPLEWKDGNFGGLGMSTLESQLFYSIGAGDGGWGPFYQNAALWALRSLLFAFASQHQQILGALAPPDPSIKGPQPLDIDPTLPHLDTTPLGQSHEYLEDDSTPPNKFRCPQYVGVQSWTDLNLFFAGPRAGPCANATRHRSFMQLRTTFEAALYTSQRVRKVERIVDQETGAVSVYLSVQNQMAPVPTLAPLTTLGPFDHAICTIPVWNAGTDVTWVGFDETTLPMQVEAALSTSHWIRAAKVFVATKKPYWLDDHDVVGRDGRTYKMMIPQDLSLNNELMGWYGQAVPCYDAETGIGSMPDTGGVALISYTFEDDAQKFLAYEPRELAVMLIAKANASLEAMGFGKNVLDSYLVAPVADLQHGQYSAFRWSLQRSYHGCARAFQQGIEDKNYALLTYNRRYGGKSGLFFAGDAYSTESGWSEPAVRMALDAVFHIVDSSPRLQWSWAVLQAGFRFQRDYASASPYTVEQAARTLTCGVPPVPPPPQQPKTKSTVLWPTVRPGLLCALLVGLLFVGVGIALLVSHDFFFYNNNADGEGTNARPRQTPHGGASRGTDEAKVLALHPLTEAKNPTFLALSHRHIWFGTAAVFLLLLLSLASRFTTAIVRRIRANATSTTNGTNTTNMMECSACAALFHHLASATKTSRLGGTSV